MFDRCRLEVLEREEKVKRMVNIITAGQPLTQMLKWRPNIKY